MPEMMMSNTNEQPNEKEQRLVEIRAKVDKITDALGHPIDEGIKDSVVAMLAHDFPSDGSCEGHLTEDENGRKFLYPSVDICAPVEDGWRDDEKIQDQWRKDNAVQRDKMKELLDEFYADREVDDEYRLVMHPRGIFNAFNMTNARGVDQELKPGDDEEEVLARSRQEMEDFTKFLMEKYYN